jgi:ABC-type Fe3+ transport system permease subunit
VLAIRISISHGVVPGIVFGLVVVGLPVLISAGCWLAASIWHPGPNSYLLFVSTGIGALAGGGLGAWLIYKTAKWLDVKKTAADPPPATDSEGTEP